MNTEQKIKTLSALGKYILSNPPELQAVITTASLHNKWFTPDNINYALKAIAENYLNESLLRKWLLAYKEFDDGWHKPTPSFDRVHTERSRSAQDDARRAHAQKKVALIMAGNIPLAGFHDLLCVLMTGNVAVIKLSSKDKDLLPFLIKKLCELEPAFKQQIEIAEQLKNFDAVIATGSNNSSRYFEYYFGKYPHIIRRNRNSVAALTGNETKADLLSLGDDIFRYFGLGCRSVSKLYVPEKYDFEKFLQGLQPYETLMLHNGYMSNYDYNRTLLIMNKVPHVSSHFLMLQENSSLASPIASLFFEYYRKPDDAHAAIHARKEEIQCVVAGDWFPDAIAFGESQKPQLWDYAEGVDTFRFCNF